MIAAILALLAALLVAAPEPAMGLSEYDLLHPGQMEVYRSDAKFRYLVCGRGWGKDHLALAEIRKAVSSPRALKLGRKFRVTYVGPSRTSIKDIAWDRLKSAFPSNFIEGEPHETNLELRLRWGPMVCLRGSDKVDRRRGPDNHLLIITEFAFCKPKVWTALKPTLRHPQDRALLITTPDGPNHALDLWQSVEGSKLWRRWQRPSWENPLHDVESVNEDRENWARSLFDQEYGARFEALSGAIYGDFSLDRNVADLELDRGLGEFYVGQDFNAGYYAAVIGQRRGERIEIVDELVTRTHLWDHRDALAKYFTSRGIDFRTRVKVFVDSSGDYNATSKVTADTSILQKAGFRCEHPRQNPPQIDRIHAVQAQLLNAAGKVRLVVGRRCAELRRCMLTQRWNQWGKADKTAGLDHLPDALGYLVWGLAPIAPKPFARSA